MITKKSLKLENIMLKEKIEQTIAESKEKDRVITTQKKHIATLELGLSLDVRMGEKTKKANLLSNAFHYYDTKNYELANDCLTMLCEITEKDTITLYKYFDRRQEKEFFFLDEILPYAQMRGQSRLTRYHTLEEADTNHKVYSAIKEAREKEPKKDFPNVLEVLLKIGKFLIIDEINGINLSDLFMRLDLFPETPAKKMLIRSLLKKQLRDGAFIATRDYGFDESILIRSDHEAKQLEVFEGKEAIHTTAEKQAILKIITPLNRLATNYFRDNASWNYRIAKEYAAMFQSDDFIFQKNPNPHEIESLVCKAVWSIDFDKLRRLTFQQDDTIHALEWPFPRLDSHKRRELEEYSILKRNEFGARGTNWQSYRLPAGFYRHTRMDLFYRKDETGYPDPEGKCKQHHLALAYQALYSIAFGNTPSFSSHEKNNSVTLRKIVELAASPRCQEKAAEIAHSLTLKAQ